MRKLKLFSRVPILAFLLVLLTTVFGVGNAWAGTYFEDTFSNVGTGSSGSILPRDGWSSSSGTCAPQCNTGVRLGASSSGATLTKTAMSGIEGTKTLKVTIYVARYNTNANTLTITATNGTIASVDGVGSLSAGTLTVAPTANAGVTTTTSAATWTNAYKTEFTITGASKTTTITFQSSSRLVLGPVKIEDAPASCSNTVTITKGAETNGTYTLSATSVCGDGDGEDVTISDITPAAGYAFDEITTSASGTVDNVNKKVTGITAATTITVKFKELPKYTVSFSTGAGNPAQADIAETVGGAGITLPDGPTPACSPTWIFAGWAEAAVGSETTTAPTLLSGTYHPSGNITLYAVYKRTESGGGSEINYVQVTALSQINAGGEFIITNGTKYLPSTTTSSSPALTDMVAVTDGVVTGTVVDAMKWTFSAADGDGYVTVKNAENKYLYSGSGNTSIRVGSTEDSWKFEEYTVSAILGFSMQEKTNSRFCSGAPDYSDWRSYTTKNATNYKTNSGRLDLYKATEVSGSTIYYLSAPTCSTPACSTPAISGTTPFLGSTEVTITCGTDGAAIYYTTNGVEPTSGSTLYEGAFNITEACTVKAIAIKDGYDNSAVASKEFEKIIPYTTIDELLVKAKEVKSTATDVYVTFNNWVVSAVKNSNAYVTDGTKGFIVYASSHGFAVNDKLSGTAACKVQLYRGSIELTSLTASTEGLTVTHDGVITPVEANIADLDTINTGAPIILKNVAFDGTNLVDADSKSIQPFNTLYSDAVSSLVEGKNYNITGIYLQYNATKEVLPRSAEDIEEMKYQLNYILPAQGTLSIKQNETLVSSGTKWVEGTEFTLSSTVPSDDYKAGVYTVTDWGEPANDVTADVLSGNTLTMPKYNVIVTVAFPEKAEPAISWSNSGAAVNVHIDNTDDLPTLTKGEFTVTCNSSDENVATVDNDGVVTMVGAGTTTISAVFAGDDDYKAKTVSYELTVLPDFYIAGNFTSWGDNKIPVAGESKTINLAAGSYELKVVTTADEWKGFENLDAATVVSGIYAASGGDANICFKLDAASNVTVSYVGGKISLVGNFAEQEIKVAGDAPFTWDGAVLELAENKLTASKTFTALEAKSYAVKMINGGSWLGNGGTINRENPSTLIVVNGDNMSFVADMAGDYTFTWTFATRTLTVTYPALPEKEYYVAGSFTNWATGKVKMTTTDDETWTATVALEADKTGANKYEFKIIETQLADTWLGLENAASMVYGNCTDWTIGGGEANIGLETTKAADYTFTYVPATKKLSVNIPQKEAGISWNASTATAYTKGKSYELPTLNNPNGLLVELSSSDEAVAYLDEGQLRIAGAGTATITATTAATGVYAAGEASYTLNVYGPAALAISGEATKTFYEKGDAFDRTGLVASVLYGDASVLVVTDLATWTNSLTDNKVNAAGDVTVTAEWQGLSGNETVAVTLLSHELTFTAPTNGTLVVEYNDAEVATGDHFLKGDVLTITATPASIDYKLASLTVNGEAFTSGSTYTVGTEDIAIVASFTKKPEPTLSWSIDPNNPKNVYLSGRDEDNVFPTAINPLGLPLTYGSLNGSVAEIDAEGNFILHEAGFASMYFNFAGNETYCSVHREYPLTVYALDRIEIGGEATATEYEAGDAFDRSGLTATAVYKVGVFTENYDVTTKATWNAAPATIAANTTQVSVTAAWNGKTSAAEEVAVTVKTHKVIFDANKNHVYLSVWNGETQISSGDEFAKGTVLTVEVELESADYVLATLTANTTDIKATKQFTIGEVDVTIEATSESKPVAPISWSAESASIAMNGDVATLPTLVNEQGLTIMYMSNNEETATIDEASGEITLVGPGEATIRAIYVATPESQYRTTFATYTLTVVAIPTALDNAEAGEKAQKIMLNNQLFILRGGKMYDAQGKLVK